MLTCVAFRGEVDEIGGVGSMCPRDRCAEWAGCLMRSRKSVYVLGCIVLALLTAGRKLDKAKLPKGISAWAYHLDKNLRSAVGDYDKEAKAGMKFAYFFPYVGSLEFKKGARTASIYYDPKKTAAYAKSLPKGVLLLPIVDARDDGKAFCGWTDQEYAKLAKRVAPIFPAGCGFHVSALSRWRFF